MSNRNLNVFFQNNKTNDIFNIIAYSRIFQGINYLHSNSLIHRDLRPFINLIDNDNIPYIADYDTVRLLDPKSADEMTEDIGEDTYTSPEQQTDSSIVSFQADIYSFGQIIYFLYEKKIHIVKIILIL
ncbi:hypothetical protein M9Y10_024771 [Tritrichomonas musculus]|uniref:Protein kinase domain-containing protein n=1 Tax=Tritrichomonas musculus TaxID=1915356 RepID=A0ABR2HB91_9EUKA